MIMSFFETYREKLTEAVLHLHTRKFFVAYPEHPGAYGETENAAGKAAFEALLKKNYEGLLQPADVWAGEEVSPWTLETLGISYPSATTDVLVQRAAEVRKTWLHADVNDRAGVLMHALERFRKRFFELAYATMHTTGQSFLMAFQASGPHAADRALEALAMAYAEQTRFPRAVDWEKPLGKTSVKLHKTYRPVGLGISLAIGCSTFPTWNSLPGIFASLACGNPVIVKPHPGAVLPLAIAIEEIQRALQEGGYDPLIVQLAADTTAKPLAYELAKHPQVKLIDYTGGSSFGNTLEMLPGKITFTEKAGVNSVIIDSVANLDAVLQNLAFSVCLYSGQMCTAPQNFFIPEDGVKEGDLLIPFNDVANRFKQHVDDLTANPKAGPGTLATLQNANTLTRVSNAKNLATVLRTPSGVAHADYPKANACTPIMLTTSADDKAVFSGELFGPIIMLVKTKNTEESIALAKSMAETHGAITCGAYTTDAELEKRICSEMEEVMTPVSINLTGFVWLNQHTAFSDFHVTGGNPAGNACLVDPNFANKRFVWVGHRKQQ